MPKLNEDVSRHLREISNLYVKGNDTYRASSFEKAATEIDLIDYDLADMPSDFTKIKGVGKSTATVISEFLSSGISTRYQELKKKIYGESVNESDIYDIVGKFRSYFPTNNPVDVAVLNSFLHSNKNIRSISQLYNSLQTKELENNRLYTLINQNRPFSNHLPSEPLLIVCGNVIKDFKPYIEIYLSGDLKRGEEVVNAIQFATKETINKVESTLNHLNIPFKREDNTVKFDSPKVNGIIINTIIECEAKK